MLLKSVYRLITSALLALSTGVAATAAESSSTAARPEVVLETTLGDIVLQLDPARSPITVSNFLQYVDAGHYDGTIFHRVIPRFMVQAGGFTKDMKEKKTRDPIVNESKNRWHNERGTVAMARTNDPDSATAQFFINVKMNLSLDYRGGQPGYTVFAQVIDGMATVDAIVYQPTTTVGPHADVPIDPIMITRARRR